MRGDACSCVRTPKERHCFDGEMQTSRMPRGSHHPCTRESAISRISRRGRARFNSLGRLRSSIPSGCSAVSPRQFCTGSMSLIPIFGLRASLSLTLWEASVEQNTTVLSCSPIGLLRTKHESSECRRLKRQTSSRLRSPAPARCPFRRRWPSWIRCCGFQVRIGNGRCVSLSGWGRMRAALLLRSARSCMRTVRARTGANQSHAES